MDYGNELDENLFRRDSLSSQPEQFFVLFVL